MNRTALLCIAFLFTSYCWGQRTVTEPSTGKVFPAEVTFKSGDVSYTLNVTGTAVRKKLVFKVYGMAHYMQDPAQSSKEDAFKAILTDGKAKQITVDMARDVDAEKIREAYTDGFKANARGDEFKTIESHVSQFVGYFTKELKENDQFIIRWLPGGVIAATVQGDEKPPITDPLFARLLWSIWFGEDSIVDRDDLVNSIAR